MNWFQIAEVAESVFVIEERGHVQSYLVNGASCSALLDTGMGFRDIRAPIQHLLRERVIVLNTHWHFDHVGGNALFPEIGISQAEEHLVEMDLPNATLMDWYVEPCWAQGIPLPPNFEPEAYEIRGVKPTFCVADGDKLDLGGRVLEAIATPGHTHGSTSFRDRRSGGLFCGDLAYQGEIYLHFEDSDLDAYIGSLRKALSRSAEFEALYPSHNDYPLPKAFLKSVLEGCRKIEEGAVRAETTEDWGEPVHRYVFDAFSVLTKMPGSKGVKLFAPGSVA